MLLSVAIYLLLLFGVIDFVYLFFDIVHFVLEGTYSFTDTFYQFGYLLSIEKAVEQPMQTILLAHQAKSGVRYIFHRG